MSEAISQFLFLIPVVLVVAFLAEPIFRTGLKPGYLDALAVDADRHRLLKNEEVLQALTELEVDYRDKRISEDDYKNARRELSQGYDSR